MGGEEFRFIDWIRKQDPGTRGRMEIGVGDDAAALNVHGQQWVLITTDMLLEGTHFDLATATVRQVGRKAVGVNRSDLAARGVPAAGLVVCVGLRQGSGMDFARELYLGMKEMADRFDVPISGGDTTSWDQGLAISITALGVDDGLKPVRRSGAQPGDVLCVTGELGGSLLGRHLDFTPRLEEGIVLNRNYALHAMIDISDGLAADLGHILDESGVGAELNLSAIPVSDDARRAAERSGRPAVQHALTDGEDFELLFALDEREAQRLLEKPPFRTRIGRIGRIVQGKGLRLIGSDGREVTMDLGGYEHGF